jgi:competence protein ComEC
MHVGMAALCWGWVLRCCLLPMKIRWTLELPGILGYVLLAGAPVSAVRALLMIAVVCYARFRFRMPSWLNALGLSGLSSLLVNPGNVLGMGFIYSYAVVAALLLAAPAIREYGEMLMERNAWLPGNLRRTSRLHLVAGLVMAFWASAAAWLAGFGTGMWMNPALNVASPLINVPLATVAFAVMACCPLKIFLCAVAASLEWLWAGLLESLMSGMMLLAECGRESPCLLMPGRFPAAFTAVFNLLFWLGLLFSWDGPVANARKE